MQDHHLGEDEDHHPRLAQDLSVMETLVARRRALKWFAGAGTAVLVTGCGGSGSDATSAADVIVPASTARCIADPTETAGPYPADGTNASSGSTGNVLTVPGIVRSDIRSSFITATTVATGVLLTLKLTVVNAACAPLAGHAVYIWHCDRNGEYSLYTVPAESYLRGVQVADGAGEVTFATIVPGCYEGRYPHIHFEVFSSLTAATGGRDAVLTSQFAMPAALCDAVYADTILYPDSATRFAAISTSADYVFGDNTAAQIAQQTPTITGSVATGYVATALIGIAR